MANKQQTAVEWLLGELTYDNGFGQKWVAFREGVDISEYFTKALQMEREQTINAYNEGVESEYQYHINSEPRITAEQYYNQTYSLPNTPFMRELTEQEADILEKTFNNYYKKPHSLPDRKPE